ncbi:DUF6320 domain-containing protein [Butyrivibrio sp. MC2013]|uniref:DUF6320 domain-containing protein n=1 Tax=Butyrivibrio sp. MC2013 TaxID=1280686 RepID=UPI0003F8255E|nr:DUF6320 domain-containing protein [Butyrivibrio sp. MC2013]
MQYCPKCKIHVRGYKTACPLCQGKLGGDPELPVYPVLAGRVSEFSIVKLVTFACAALAIIMFIIRYFAIHDLGVSADWTGIVIFAAFLVWLDTALAFTLRGNVLKMVTFEAYAIMVVLIGVDRYTGFFGWSFAVPLPLIFLFLLIFTTVYGLVTGSHFEDMVYYLLMDFIACQLQWIPMLKNMNPMELPAVISIAIYLILLVAVLIFRFRDLKNASVKMWNV